jgi:hypothetical protein
MHAIELFGKHVIPHFRNVVPRDSASAAAD